MAAAHPVKQKTSYEACQNHVKPCDRKQFEDCKVATIFSKKNGTCDICSFENESDKGCSKAQITLAHTKDVVVTFHKNCVGAEYKWEGELDSAFH